MSYVSHVAGPSRIFDHVYDPLFEASSGKDVWKANYYAVQRSAPVQILSIFNSMFSDMPRRPRYRCWRQQNPLPHYPHKGGDFSLRSSFMQKVAERKNICIEGSCRCNYFHYPPQCVTALNLKLQIPPECKCLDTPKNKFETVGCQTIYRESSAQTQPYLPDSYVAEGETETPEVLRVANLITGDEEPGEFEARIVERTRKRRYWEKQLPPPGSPEEWDKRRTCIEAFEWEEFLAREDDIQEVQDLRMEVVKKLVAKREASMRASSAVKLEYATSRIEETRKENIKKLNHKFNRDMRKLELSHRNIPRKYQPPNIVQEHMNQASELYAPQMRFGVHPKRRHFVPFKSLYQARLKGLEKKPVVPNQLQCAIRRYDKLAQPKQKAMQIRKGFNRDDHLTKLYESLKILRNKSSTEKTLPKCLEKIHKSRQVTAETPLRPSEDVYEESELQCCIYLQKIIKGRSIQKMLYNGRDRCRGLIEEIQTTHQLSSVSAMYPGMTNNTIRRRLCVQKQQNCIQKKKQQDKETIEIFKESEGHTLGWMLQFLEKELRRMYEQRKIHAICILAERERMRREAAEAGRRQIENRRRRETEEIYHRIMKSSHDTISMYLENVLVEETTKVAEEDARQKVQAMAKRIDLEASQSMSRRCQNIKPEQSEGIIDDLVNNFVFPEVRKRIARGEMENKRRRHLLAAHESLYGQISDVFHIPTPRTSASQIASGILNNLVCKILSCESVLSKIDRKENIAKHEAMTAIRTILKRILPNRKWKNSAERIVTATVSELITGIVNELESQARLPPEYQWLQKTIDEISDRLWQYAVENVKECEEARKETVQAELYNFLQEKLMPINVVNLEDEQKLAQKEYSETTLDALHLGEQVSNLFLDDLSLEDYRTNGVPQNDPGMPNPIIKELSFYDQKETSSKPQSSNLQPDYAQLPIISDEVPPVISNINKSQQFLELPKMVNASVPEFKELYGFTISSPTATNSRTEQDNATLKNLQSASKESTLKVVRALTETEEKLQHQVLEKPLDIEPSKPMLAKGIEKIEQKFDDLGNIETDGKGLKEFVEIKEDHLKPDTDQDDNVL